MTVSDTHADTIRAAIKADSYRDTDDLILKGHGYNALDALVAEVERVTGKADCGGINCGKCQQCLTVHEYFLKESVTALRAEVEREREDAANIKRDYDDVFGQLLRSHGELHRAEADLDKQTVSLGAALFAESEARKVAEGELERERARADRAEAALILVRDWIREGKGNEADATEAMDAALSAGSGGRLGEDGEVTAPLRSRVAPETVERSSGPSSPSRAGGRETTP